MSEKIEKNVDERKPYTLEVEPINFTADAEVRILTSNKLCRLVNEYFKAAFADFEGSTFEMSQGAPTISLVFNHLKYSEDQITCCAMASTKSVSNSVIERSRTYDRLAKEGDRYHITEEGKDIIKKLLAPRYYNGGDIKWGNIVCEYVEKQMYGYGGVQFTKIVGIDPRLICAIIFGAKDGDSTLDYAVDVKFDLSTKNGFAVASMPNYVLHITRANYDHIKKTYEDLGFGSAGSTIVR